MKEGTAVAVIMGLALLQPWHCFVFSEATSSALEENALCRNVPNRLTTGSNPQFFSLVSTPLASCLPECSWDRIQKLGSKVGSVFRLNGMECFSWEALRGRGGVVYGGHRTFGEGQHPKIHHHSYEASLIQSAATCFCLSRGRGGATRQAASSVGFCYAQGRNNSASYRIDGLLLYCHQGGCVPGCASYLKDALWEGRGYEQQMLLPMFQCFS